MQLPDATAVALKPETLHRIEEIAKARHQTLDTVLSEAIEEYIERRESQSSLNRDTIEAWQSYQETGLHVTGDEVETWLAKLEAGESAPPPSCHL